MVLQRGRRRLQLALPQSRALCPEGWGPLLLQGARALISARPTKAQDLQGGGQGESVGASVPHGTLAL